MCEPIVICTAINDIRVNLKAFRAGKDLAVVIDGGDCPHIGAVAVSQPRPSLNDDGNVSATTSVIALLGHKEDGVAKVAAEKIASRLNVTVSVSCGIHIDFIKEEQLKNVKKLVGEVTDELIWSLNKRQDA